MSFSTNINDINVQRFLAGLYPLIGKAFLFRYDKDHHHGGVLTINYWVTIDVIIDGQFTGRYPEYKEMTISYKMFTEMLDHMHGSK